MEPKFLEFYNQELKFIRENAAEFASEYPKIAGRLAIDGFDCADPYVERLLEGFAFLSARIHLKMDASFPKFTQHLLELIYPGFLTPSPSMLLAQFTPDTSEGSLLQGVTIPRETILHSGVSKDESTSCKYSLAQDVQLWPMTLQSAEYLTAQTVATITTGTNYNRTAKSGILLKFEVPDGMSLNELSIDNLPVFLRGSESFPSVIYESLLKGFLGVMFRGQDKAWKQDNQLVTVIPNGFSANESLLPRLGRQFDGIRLLREYFLFDKKFLSVRIQGLKAITQQVQSKTIELLLLMSHADSRMDNRINKDNFQLYCSPAINLFRKKAERIGLSQIEHELHVVADRIRPLDYEVCYVTSVEGLSSGNDRPTPFFPLYQFDRNQEYQTSGYYSVAREVRKLSAKQVKYGHRSSYIGSEVYVSLVEPTNVPFSNKLKQLVVEVMCSNRDLPLMMPLGKTNTDFTIETGAPCLAVRCLGEPTRPHPPLARGNSSWELIQQLAVNFLGFSTTEHENTIILKRLLSLLVDPSDSVGMKQVEGVVAVQLSTLTRRLPIAGPICFGRGVEIKVVVDKQAFEGGSAFVLSAVLEVFFAQYVSVNSFTQFVLCSNQDGEIYRWPVRTGLQQHI